MTLYDAHDDAAETDYWGNEADMSTSHGRYQLAYVDLYDPHRHGFDNQVSDKEVHGQFLCNMTVDVEQWRLDPKRVSCGEESVESTLEITVLLNNGGEGGSDQQEPVVTGEIDGLYISATEQFIPYSQGTHHPLVRRAYDREFVKKMSGQLQVVELDYLSGGETICIPKTYALRLFQRRCRNFLNRQHALRRRFGNPRALINRETLGRF